MLIRVLQVFGKFIPCLRDSNNRVKLSALHTLEQILPSMSGSMPNLTLVTIETVASNLGSSTHISKAAAAVLDAFMEHFGEITTLNVCMIAIGDLISECSCVYVVCVRACVCVCYCVYMFQCHCLSSLYYDHYIL